MCYTHVKYKVWYPPGAKKGLTMANKELMKELMTELLVRRVVRLMWLLKSEQPGPVKEEMLRDFRFLNSKLNERLKS